MHSPPHHSGPVLTLTFVNDEDGHLVPDLIPVKRPLHISPAARHAFRSAIDAAMEGFPTAAHICSVCHADAQFKTDHGDRCEHHLLTTSDWREAERL